MSLRNRGLSESYISKLSEYLGKFCDWLGNTLVTPGAESAQNYLSKSNHLKPNSRARYATYLKGFLNYLGIPFDVKVKVPKTLPDYVETSDIDQIVQWIKNRHSHKNSISRDLTLLETAKRTGMRRSELANLKVRDVSLDKNRLFVRAGKGDKDRVIPIHTELKIASQTSYRARLRRSVYSGLKPRSLGNKFRNWSNQAGVDLHTHSFRHHFATKLVERGANIRAVQELLGHTNLNTTQVYLSVTADHLEDAIQLLE
jgi:integrase/recombinase XerD